MSDLPRLLLCSFDVIPGPSGSSRRLTEYLKALPDRFSVVVLSAKTPDHSHIEKYQGARLLRVPVGAGDLISRIQAFERAVRRQLESEEYALAHFTDPFGGYALCELKEDYGYRLIYEAQGFPSQELRYTHPQLEGDRRFLSRIRRQELFCLMNADLVLTGSPTTRSFIHSLGVSQESVRVVRAPVNLEPYPPEALGVPDGQPMRLVYLGSQVPWQGLPGLLRGLALAVQQVDVRLSIIGPRHPDWQPHLEDLVKELGLTEHVEFQPPVGHDDVAKVLALGDVGVLPLEDTDRNRVQGGPLTKVAEYLAAGRPVLAADLPVARELVPSSAAIFYAPGDAQALASRITELARNVPQRIALGRQARAFAEQRLDAGLIRGQLLDIYDALLGKRELPEEPPAEASLPPSELTGTPTNRILALTLPEQAPAPAPTLAPDAPAPRVPEEPAARTDTPREELPLVLGHAMLEDGLDTRLIKTEPDVRQDGPPVVMGLPLREPQPLDFAPTEPDVLQDGPPVVMGLPLREPSLPQVEPEELAEVAPEELHEVDATPTPAYALPHLEELEELSSEELEEELVEAAEPGAPPRQPPESRLNPWFAQLAHGYCPPEGTHFTRHTPPTNFPGRDEEQPPPPSAQAQGTSRGRPS
ncbi:MAG TPA: glycosyltransferase family 4 protein [Myxococcaceae bacterium]|nr:glycosyltransferase family 4 protein [Myxococcaceae bacterium]